MSNDEKTFWEQKIRKHWKGFLIFIVAAIVVFIGAYLELVFVISTNTIGNFGMANIGEWTIDWVVGFFVQYTLWTLLVVGTPAALFFILGMYLWWRSLPEEEKKEFKDREKREKVRRKEKYGGGGGFGLAMFIGYCLYHLVMETNNVQFASRPYTYWLFTYFATLLWIFIVLGLPIIVILIIAYFAVWRKKSE